MIAFLEAQRAGLLRRKHWARNILAGLIVGVVSLPLSMAFAIASGVKPEQGLYTAIIAGLLVTLFGGSRVQVAGPTGAFIVILLGIVQEHGYSGLQLATLMAGGMLVVMGVARLGAAIRFIPAPVIAGFTAGIGVIIWVGQWPDFFGIPAPSGRHFHEKLPILVQSLPGIHGPTTFLAFLGLALVIGGPRLPGLQRIPGPLTAMVVVTLVQHFAQFPGVATIESAFGGIPSGLPKLDMPVWSVNLFLDLLGPAFTIAMLCAIESLLSAVVADGMIGTRHDSNQELIGQGVANAFCAMFGGIAATGAIARTALNIRNGGNSPIAGIVGTLTLVAIIVFLAPLASGVPLAVLAAILFVVAWNMSDVRDFVRMVQRAPVADVAVLLITFALTVFADLVVAVSVGVILAMLHFLRRMATAVEVTPELIQGGGPEAESDSLPAGVQTYAINGPFFFAATESFERALATAPANPRALIIRLARVPFIDITGIHAIEVVADQLSQRDVRVILCEANARVFTKLDRAGLINGRGDATYVETMEEALKLSQDALESATA